VIGIGDSGAGMDRAARAIERIVDEIKRTLPGEACLVAERDFDLVSGAVFCPHTIARILKEIRLAHIEIQPDRIKRDHCRKQGRRRCRGTAAGDQIADGDEMRADASCEGRRNPAMFEIKLCVADLSLGVVHGGLRAALVGRALIHGLLSSE
jgi:hypothetical protein